ncbi:MAG: hypothetical protein GY820_04500 [Gammaproteobacteria bacterium]|nr:hypothetical protein [Gammaproteobacteria bacterium]
MGARDNSKHTMTPTTNCLSLRLRLLDYWGDEENITRECPSVEQEEYNLTGKRLDLSNTIFIRNRSLAKKEACVEKRAQEG